MAPGGVHFRVWAPARKKVEVELRGEPGRFPLQPEPCGYFAGLVQGARVGSLYKYRLDDEGEYPDPASRFQPQGPDEWSQVVDPAQFPWTDQDWRGIALHGQVIYEMHVGTFTREGTWQSAVTELPHLAATGVSVLGLMPVGEFPGRFGWGYDGVHPFAPTRLYGEPDDFRRFVDQAHAVGLGVILTSSTITRAAGNHFLLALYFSDTHRTDWGRGIKPIPVSGPVREFCLKRSVLDRQYLDGLRLDATQDIHPVRTITSCEP
jgi:maltooligosyltrehalose trehalohydrolase